MATTTPARTTKKKPVEEAVDLELVGEIDTADETFVARVFGEEEFTFSTDINGFLLLTATRGGDEFIRLMDSLVVVDTSGLTKKAEIEAAREAERERFHGVLASPEAFDDRTTRRVCRRDDGDSGKRGRRELVHRLIGWAVAEGRLEIIRGRRIQLGLNGLNGLSLSAFCDLVWLELWDDCGPMGDQVKYREAIKTIFYEGRDPDSVEFVDAEGNKRTIRKPGTASSVGTPIPSHALDALKDMQAQVAALNADPE